MHCVPDFLRSLGYNLLAYATGSLRFMGMKSFLQQHGFKMYNSADHHCLADDQLFDLLEMSVLPRLADRKEWPFVLLVLNEDTHIPYLIGKQRNDSLQRSMGRIEQLGLANHSEILIYGDDPTMGKVDGKVMRDRNLTLFFPTRPQDMELEESLKKKTIMTYYDIAPTVMNLLGVEYSPPFPFGADFFGTAVGSYPSDVGLCQGTPEDWRVLTNTNVPNDLPSWRSVNMQTYGFNFERAGRTACMFESLRQR
jgi:phosphoglycerol transferase MdoB-like AlkP superfamily enzyme